MRIRNPAYRDQEESSASDESQLLSLRSEIALTDGLALALGEFPVDMKFFPLLMYCLLIIVFVDSCTYCARVWN
jgi:hypothetical protein